MSVPCVHAGGKPLEPLTGVAVTPAYIPMVPGAEAAGIVKLRALFEKCPYVGTADEMVPVLLAVAGEAIAAVVQDLALKGYLSVPPHAMAEVMECVPIAVLHAVTIAITPKKESPVG